MPQLTQIDRFQDPRFVRIVCTRSEDKGFSAGPVRQILCTLVKWVHVHYVKKVKGRIRRRETPRLRQVRKRQTDSTRRSATARTTSPAANASVSPSPVPSSAIPQSLSWTKPRITSTSRPAKPSRTSSRGFVRDALSSSPATTAKQIISAT